MQDLLFVLLQYLLPQHLISRLIGHLADSQQPWLRDILIRQFIRAYDVDLSEAERESPDDYANFNDFFTRALKADARPLADADDAIVCPADGCVSQIGRLRADRLLQAKGREFSVLELIGGDVELAQSFHHGHFATIYLSPRDYHRVHMPLAGTLRRMIHIPGDLFSVNAATTREVPQLFARNERLVCLFETACGPMAVILVGAMIVAGIETVWSGLVTPRGRRAQSFFYADRVAPVQLARGAEMGRFRLGSTAIVLLPAGISGWHTDLDAGRQVRMGESLGRCSPSPGATSS